MRTTVPCKLALTGAHCAGMDVDAKEPAASKEAAKPEPSSHMLDNPARVTPGQEQYIAFSADQRWQPLSAHPPHSGILMCTDTRPGLSLDGLMPDA